jgi:hypothetical protein
MVVDTGRPVGSPGLQVLEGTPQAMSQMTPGVDVTVVVDLHPGRQVVQGHSSMTETVQPLVIVGGGVVLGCPAVQVLVAAGQNGQITMPVGVVVIVVVEAQLPSASTRLQDCLSEYLPRRDRISLTLGKAWPQPGRQSQ